MTALDLTPYWGDDHDWSGFLLLIAPVTALPVSAEKLSRLVREHVESDAALYDLVKVAHCAARTEYDGAGEWGRAFLASLLGAAMPERHFLAPRAVLNVVVVGEDAGEIARMMRSLDRWEPLRRLRVRLYGREVRSDGQFGGVAKATVEAIAGVAVKAMASYERRPEIALDERAFLAEADGLILRRVIAGVKFPAPQGSGPTHATTPPQANATAAAGWRPGTETSAPLGKPSPSGQRPPQRAPQAPVFHAGEDVVTVDSRPPWQRLRGDAPTDATAIDRLAAVTDAVSLAYLVAVPDEESGRAARGYRKHALSIDQLLSTVVADALTGRSMRVAVEVLTAVSPLQKHGVLRPAGELTEADLPRLPADLFTLGKTVDALIGVAQRTAHAFAARRVQVLSLHYIFLSGVPLRFTHTNGADWDRLLRFARATWVEIDAVRATDGDPLAERFARLPDVSPSEFGFHVVPDDYDVPALVRDKSSTLYVYKPPPDGPLAGEKPRRQWWDRISPLARRT